MSGRSFDRPRDDRNVQAVKTIQTLTIALAFAMPGCGGDGGGGGASPWTVVQEGHRDGLLLSVRGRGPDDVWAVGGRRDQSLVMRGDGDRLSPIASPGQATAWWVCDLGDDATAVVGDGGMVLLDRGEGLVAQDFGLEGTLYGCFGEAVDDWWIVGGDRARGTPELVHVTAAGAAAPDLHLPLGDLPTVFYKVWGAQGRLWFVGDQGGVLTRSPAGEWAMQRLGASPLFTVHGAGPDDVWAVGGTADAKAWHWDGSSWVDASPHDRAGLSGVFVEADGSVWASGMFGLLMRREGERWADEDSPTDQTLHAVWADGAGGVWAVGGNVEDPNQANWRGVALRR